MSSGKADHLNVRNEIYWIVYVLPPVRALITFTSSKSIVFVQLKHFSPDNFVAGKGLSAVESATLRRANGPVRIAFHTYKIKRRRTG